MAGGNGADLAASNVSVADGEAASDEAGKAVSSPAAAPASPARRLLVVDDETPVRNVTVEMLTSLGHTVLDVSSGQEALRLLEQCQFDLVITDHAMAGGMSGQQLAATIKARHPDLPVALLTGFGDLIAASGEAAGAVDAILTKPTKLSVLSEAVLRLTSRRPGSHEAGHTRAPAACHTPGATWRSPDAAAGPRW
jgi:CheY-like chemotaxis protein